MSAMLNDYKVDFLREGTIESLAQKCRIAAAIENVAYFNVVYFVTVALQKFLQDHKGGTLKYHFFDAPPGGKFAYVTFNPLTLHIHIDQEIWDLAEKGDPLPRFIIAHEIGDIVLHNHFATAFSIDSNVRIKFLPKEYSAEWQANTFAAYFLLPTNIVAAFADSQSLAKSGGVPLSLAEDRTKAVFANRRRRFSFDGDACTECGNFTLVRNGIWLKCNTCGSTTGCS